MTEEWARDAYRNLLAARRTWQKLREKYPDAYDYDKKITEINQKLRFLKNWMTTRSRKNAGSARRTEGSRSEGTILQPDTIPERTDTVPEESRWFSDVFFEDEGIVAVDLPAESELNVSGRKFIKANLKSTKYPNNPQRESSSDLTIDQQLQVKVRGSVADDLLEVRIDFDDSLPKVERQKTKVLYNGRERDVGLATLQAQGKFGDVNLSLPGSTFTSYNKSVFGLSGQAHLTDFQLGSWGPEKVSLYAVASEKKGETKKKVFTGSNQRRIPDPVADINPVRRTYYQPLADRSPGNRSLPIEVDSERILLDDRNAENNDANTLEDKQVSNGSDTYVGDFDVLQAGDDYTINYRTGVIRFKRSVQDNFALAVTLTRNDGTQLSDFLIKDPPESDRYDKYHLLNRYQLASRNIVRDDPNRVLEIRDASDATQPNGGQSYAQLLNVDRNNDGVIDDEFIDFELGVLRFPDTRPFVSSSLASNADTNPTVYGPPSERQKVYEIYQEILVEENSYSLGVNVVRGSENVTVDGQNLERGSDYTIDYQTGFLTFFDHVKIDEETTIEVTYEQQGVGAQRDQTFLGGRVEARFSDNLSMGSTLLTSKQAEQGRVPQVGNNSKSTEISEYDVDWEPLHTAQDILGLIDDGWGSYPLDNNLTLDMSYEKAKSTRNPAQEGLALVDGFSQLDQRIVFSKGEFDWFPADPIQQFVGGSGVLDSRSKFTLNEVEDQGHDPDPEEDQSQKSLRVNFEMGTSSAPDTWGSIQQVFSPNGRDLRGYQYIEFWVKWENNAEGGTLAVDLGEVTENTNRGGLLTEDKNNDDVLNPGEDKGYFTHDFRFGKDNGQLDSEDLDRNGRLDEDEGYLHFPAVNKADTVIRDTTPHGWTLLKVPLRSTFGETRGNANRLGQNPSDTPTRAEVLRNASMVRLTYRSPDASGKDRSFLLEQMGAVRTRWQTPRDTANFSLDVKTSAEDPRLPAPNTGNLRENDDRIEKALSYTFQGIDSGDSLYTRARIDFPGGQEIRQFRKLNLFFNTKNYTTGMGDGDTGFVRFGTNENNFFEYSFPLENPGSDPSVRQIGDATSNWFRLSIDLSQFEQDLIKKTLFDTSPETFRQGSRRIVGTPSLLKVKQYVIGFVGPSTSQDGELLFEGFHVSKPRKEVGEAEELKAKVNLQEGLIKVSGKERKVDGEFRTIGLVNNAVANDFVAQNEESRQLNGSVDVNRYIPNSWSISVPLQFNWSDKTTRIPPDRIERVRNDNLGTVVRRNQKINSGLSTPGRYPNFSFSWKETEKNVDQERRRQEWSEERKQWNLNGNYALSFRKPIGGYFPVGNRLNMSFNGKYGRLTDRRRTFGEVDVDTEAREQASRKLSTTINHEPWDWLDSRTRLNFSDLNRTTLNSEGLVKRNQSVDFEFDFANFWGLQPRFNLGTGIQENYDRGGSVSKNVALNGNTSLKINTNPERWWSELDFLTLNYNYTVSSSARYSSLEPSTGNGRIYRNFYQGLGWVLNGPDIKVTSDTLTLSRNRASKNVSHRLGGQLRLLSSLDSRYNINLSQNTGQSDNSVNVSDAISLSLSNRLRLQDVSSLFRENTQNASLDLDYSYSQSESANKVSRTHSPNVSLNTRWNRWWSTNFNLSMQFNREEDRAVVVQGRRYSPSLDFKWLINEAGSDEGTLWFDNRLQINGGLSGQVQERTRNGETRQDEWDASANFGGSYNVTERIKTRFGGSYSIFRDDFRGANDRNSYGFNGSLDFRF